MATEPSLAALDDVALAPLAARPRQPGTGHRRRTSGPAGAVVVQETIQEEPLPRLSHSPSTPSTGNLEHYPSPLFLKGREPDIASFSEDPYSVEALRGYSEWERDAYFEHSASQAKFLDTEFSRSEISRPCLSLCFMSPASDF